MILKLEVCVKDIQQAEDIVRMVCETYKVGVIYKTEEIKEDTDNEH